MAFLVTKCVDQAGVKPGNFEHRVNSDIQLQTVEILKDYHCLLRFFIIYSKN